MHSLILFCSLHDLNRTVYSLFVIIISGGNKAELLKMKNEYMQLRSGKDGECAKATSSSKPKQETTPNQRQEIPKKAVHA